MSVFVDSDAVAEAYEAVRNDDNENTWWADRASYMACVYASLVLVATFASLYTGLHWSTMGRKL